MRQGDSECKNTQTLNITIPLTLLANIFYQCFPTLKHHNSLNFLPIPTSKIPSESSFLALSNEQ